MNRRCSFYVHAIALLALARCSSTINDSIGSRVDTKTIKSGPAQPIVSNIPANVSDLVITRPVSEPFVPAGPPLAPEMERLSVGFMTWIDRETTESLDDRSISISNPTGRPFRVSLQNVFTGYADAETRMRLIDTSILQDLWTTRGIRIGETKRYYPFMGTLEVNQNNEILWSYSFPVAFLNADGSPVPPQPVDSGTYVIKPNMEEYACFWRQVSYYPKSNHLQFPLPDMLVVEQCLIAAGIKPNEAFQSSKDAKALNDRENTILRARSPQ